MFIHHGDLDLHAGSLIGSSKSNTMVHKRNRDSHNIYITYSGLTCRFPDGGNNLFHSCHKLRYYVRKEKNSDGGNNLSPISSRLPGSLFLSVFPYFFPPQQVVSWRIENAEVRKALYLSCRHEINKAMVFIEGTDTPLFGCG